MLRKDGCWGWGITLLTDELARDLAYDGQQPKQKHVIAIHLTSVSTNMKPVYRTCLIQFWLADIRHENVVFREEKVFCSDVFLLQSGPKIPPLWFSDIFPKRLGILVQILHAYYKFLFTFDYNFFLFNYLQLWQRDWPLSSQHMLKMSAISRNARWVVALNMA